MNKAKDLLKDRVARVSMEEVRVTANPAKRHIRLDNRALHQRSNPTADSSTLALLHMASNLVHLKGDTRPSRAATALHHRLGGIRHHLQWDYYRTGRFIRWYASPKADFGKPAILSPSW